MNAKDLAPHTTTIQLRCGRELVLEEMSFLELRDLGARAKEEKEEDKVLGWAFVLWLLCRKHGVSKGDQVKGKWLLTFDELLADLTIEDLKEHAEATKPFLPVAPAAGTPTGSPPAPAGSG
jgi:hypothetical protein